jgi:hypothetical protein
MKPTRTLDINPNLRIGQAIYNAVYSHLKGTGKGHKDSEVLDYLHSITDACLVKLLKDGAA